MSVEAITWALNLAPVPMDGAKPSATCAAVLIGLANHAGPDGTAAFPAVSTLVRYTRLSERTVRYCLDRLEQDGIIVPCDQEIIDAKIKRADLRPKGWNLSVQTMRSDLSDDEIQRISKSSPILKGFIASATRHNGVQRLHPSKKNEVQPLHLDAANGVQPTTERGAAAAPEPYIEPSIKEEKKGADAPALLLVKPSATEKKKAKRAKSEEITFTEFESRCIEHGEAAIPAGHRVFAYIDEIKLPAAMLELAYVTFEDKHRDSSKTYVDWRKAFLTCVKDNWYRLWWFDDASHEWQLTQRGRQAQMELDAKRVPTAQAA